MKYSLQICRPEIRKNILSRTQPKVEETTPKVSTEASLPPSSSTSAEAKNGQRSSVEETTGLTIVLPSPPEEEMAPATSETSVIGEQKLVEDEDEDEDEEEEEAVPEDPELASLITTLKVGS